MYTLKPAIFVTFAAAIFTASTAPTNANTDCQNNNAACDPQVECEDISWTCSVPGPTTSAGAQIPREDQYCCDYLGTCSSGREVSGKVSSRKITVQTYQGVVHETDWWDLYIETGGESDHTGSWISHRDNEDDNVTDYYTEPNNTCSDADGTHVYPGWYHVALACVYTDKLQVQDLSIETPQSKTCEKEWKTECDIESQTCDVTTVFSGDEHPNSTIPAIVEEWQCDKILDDFTKEVKASSILVSGLDAERTAGNLQVLNGWVPNFDDSQLWVKVSFSLEAFVVGVVTQGLAQDVERRVDSFKVKYENSAEGQQWVELKGQAAVFYAGARLDTTITNYFLQPVKAIAVTIYVETPADAKKVGMRFMLRGCKVCENHTDCDGGQCKYEGGMCSYGDEETGVDPTLVKKGVDDLEQQNATEAEVEAFKTLLGQGAEGSNISTINPEDVTLNVATAAIDALNSSLDTDSSSNSSEVENTVVAIEKVGGLLGVLSDEDNTALHDLDSPEKVEAAEEMIGKMASLVNELLDPDNSAAWDLLGDMAVENEGGSADNDTADGGGGGGGEPDGSDDTTTEAEEAAAEKKQKAKTQASINFMTGITSMASAVAKSGANVTIRTPNLEVVAVKPSPKALKENGFTFETKSDKLGARLDIAASTFANEEDLTITTAVTATSVIMSEETASPVASGKLASSLLSVQAVGKDGTHKSFPVEYELPHREPMNDSEGNPIEKSGCAYHDEEIKEFSRKGMKVKEAEANRTKCKSSHITTFAVMMFLDDLDELGKHFKIQSDITKYCGGLSIIFLAIAIAVFIYLRSTLMSDRIIIHLTLMVITGVSMLAFLLGSDKTNHKLLCKIITVILHFLYTAMFSWMLVEGLHLYRQIITVFESGKSRLWVYFVLGWGVPVIIVGVATAIQWDKYGKGEVCFLMNEDGTIWAFIGPIIPVILINFVVLCRVIQIVIAASKLDGAGNTVVRVKAGLRSSVLLLPILGMTWVVGYFQHLDISLSYIFVILNSLQGFFMAIFHCFLNTEVREALRGAIKKAKDSSIGGHSMIDSTDKKSMMGSHKKSMMGSSTISRNKVAPSPIFD